MGGGVVGDSVVGENVGQSDISTTYGTGFLVGLREGLGVGWRVGLSDGDFVGIAVVGCEEGGGVGFLTGLRVLACPRMRHSSSSSQGYLHWKEMERWP